MNIAFIHAHFGFYNHLIAPALSSMSFGPLLDPRYPHHLQFKQSL